MITKKWFSSILIHVFSLSGLIILLNLTKSDFFHLKFDGNTFFITGQRILNGNIATIYEVIVGSGPYTYSPYASMFFAFFALIGEHSLQLVCLTALYLSYLVVFRHIKIKFQNINLKLLLLISILAFSSIIFESLYIGQIDSLILLFLVLAFLYVKDTRLSILLISFTTLFKPQFFVFAIVFYFLKKEELPWQKFLNICLVFLMPHFLFLCLLLIAISGSLDILKNLFIRFFENSRMISGNFDVTNQSLSAVLNRLLSSNKFEGRYFPEIFAPKVYIFETFELSPILIRIVYLSLIILILMFLLKNYRPKYRSNDNLFALTLLSLPSLSPLFWQVHAIFLIPSFLLLSAAFIKDTNRFNKTYFVLYLLVILISNPILFDGKVADLSLALGSTYFFSILSIYFFKKHYLDFNFK